MSNDAKNMIKQLGNSLKEIKGDKNKLKEFVNRASANKDEKSQENRNKSFSGHKKDKPSADFIGKGLSINTNNLELPQETPSGSYKAKMSGRKLDKSMSGSPESALVD